VPEGYIQQFLIHDVVNAIEGIPQREIKANLQTSMERQSLIIIITISTPHSKTLNLTL